MTPAEETPPSILELLAATPPSPRHIALHVTVESAQGQRAYWMTEGGVVFMRRLDGTLLKADEQQTKRVMKGLELARHSKSFTVRGRIAEAAELDQAQGFWRSSIFAQRHDFLGPLRWSGSFICRPGRWGSLEHEWNGQMPTHALAWARAAGLGDQRSLDVYT